MCVAVLAAIFSPTTPALAQSAGGRAGAAATDITPIPGLPTGGYGSGAARARGYWSPLRATAFYFEDPQGRGLALVSVDTFAIPTALHQAVAKEVGLPLERVVIAATHTHKGPANYLSAAAYNEQGSSVPGYHDGMRTFLRQQIVAAVQQARDDSRRMPAATVDVVTGIVDADLFRNRSPGVFLENGNRLEILNALGAGVFTNHSTCSALREYREPERDWDVEGCPRLRAVDRNVTLVRIRRNSQTQAMAAFVNAHPTVLPMTTALNSADFLGIARAAIEDSLGNSAPMIGFFNGSEGDVVTRRTTRTAVDLARIGQSFARQLRRIHDRGTPEAVDLAAGITGRLHFARAGDVETPTGQPEARLAREAIAGVATLGGAEGDETAIHGLATPRTQAPQGDQGVKVPALGLWLRRLILPPHKAPQALPLGIVRLGSLKLATVPTEASTAAAWQIRHMLGNAPHGKLELISMANEYASYLATEDEYQVQDYMGASTLWGPQQARFFAAVLQRLDREPGDMTSGVPGEDRPGQATPFGLYIGPARAKPQDGFEDLLDGGLMNGRDLPTFEWCDTRPVTLAAGPSQVEVVSNNTPERDRMGVAVILREVGANGRRWAAIWLTPLWAQRLGSYRFRVTEDGQTTESASFRVGGSPASACRESRTTPAQ